MAPRPPVGQPTEEECVVEVKKQPSGEDVTQRVVKDSKGRESHKVLVSYDTPEGEMVEEEIWTDGVAELLCNACPLSLKGKHCIPDLCPYLHVCPDWTKARVSGFDPQLSSHTNTS